MAWAIADSDERTTRAHTNTHSNTHALARTRAETDLDEWDVLGCDAVLMSGGR